MSNVVHFRRSKVKAYLYTYLYNIIRPLVWTIYFYIKFMIIIWKLQFIFLLSVPSNLWKGWTDFDGTFIGS